MKKFEGGTTIAQKAAICGVLAALALIFSYIEVLIPVVPGIPGIKLGLANLVVILALYLIDAGTAFTVNLVRIIMAALLFSGMFGFLYSLAGALVSYAGMYLLTRSGLFSVIGVSMAGGVLHNAAQLVVAALLISGPQIFHYLPVLILSGTFFGILIGITAGVVIKHLRQGI